MLTYRPKSLSGAPATSSSPEPAFAPSSVHRTLRSPGSALDPQTEARAQTRLGADFSRVRIHTDDKAATSAHDIYAHAYTVGQHVVFNRGRYQPHSSDGFALLTHELTHTLQQGSAAFPNDLALGDPLHSSEREASSAAHGHPTAISSVSPRVQRQSAPPPQAAPALTGRSASDVMADPLYLDNHLKSIQLYEARLAVLHYDNGSTLKLGLVPELLKAPVEAVDYRTLRSSHTPILGGGDSSKLRFIPHGKEAVEQMSDSAPISQVLQFARDISFKVDPLSGRIVPTEVNSLSAPVLCQVLREAEAEYVKNFDASAAGGKLVFEKLKVIVELLGFVEGLGAPKNAAPKAAGGAGAAAAAGAETTLTRKFLELLAKKVPGEVAAGGVAYGDVEVALEGTELMVRRSLVENVSRIPGQGKLMQVVWEKAAIAAAKQAGAKSVQISLRTLQNVTWKAFLESQGYVPRVVDKLHGAFGVESALVKTISL